MNIIFIANEILPAVALAFFGLAFIVDFKSDKAAFHAFSSVFLFAASLCCAATLIIRGVVFDTVPMRSMFEIFVLLGAMVWVVSLFCNKVCDAAAPIVDGVLGFVVMIPAVFVFARGSGPIPPILQSPFFIPHVLAYMISYLLIARGTVFAISVLVGAHDAGRMDSQMRLAFPFMTAGLILGAVWGKMAWGDWWNWDPKELWSLATWCVFAGYLYLRSEIFGERYSRLAAVLAIIGFVFVILTLFWVNFSQKFDSIHNYV